MSGIEERARNRLIKLAGQFTRPVRVETAVQIGPGVFLLQVRHANGQLDRVPGVTVPGTALRRPVC